MSKQHPAMSGYGWQDGQGHSPLDLYKRIAVLEAERTAYSIVNTRQAEQIVDLEASQKWLQHFSDDVTAKMEYQTKRAEQAEAELAALKGRINAALNVGHNDDCLFCGFKDKFLLHGAARAEEGGE